MNVKSWDELKKLELKAGHKEHEEKPALSIAQMSGLSCCRFFLSRFLLLFVSFVLAPFFQRMSELSPIRIQPRSP